MKIHRGTFSKEERIRRYRKLIEQGELKRAREFIIRNEVTSKVLRPTDIDSKTNLPVSEVLEAKHPPQRVDNVVLEELTDYDSLPAKPAIHVSPQVIESTVRKLRGSAGAGGIDAPTLKHWFLHYGEDSTALCEEFAEFTSWICNELNPIAIRGFLTCRLIALDKCPGVRPIGIGETIRRLFVKSALWYTRDDAAELCNHQQLSGGAPNAIEAGIHLMHQMWDEHKEDPDWGIMVLDMENAFNLAARIPMLWTLRHECASLSYLAFNCYSFCATLKVKTPDGNSYKLLSKEGVTQGCPLSMIIYGITTLPIIRELNHLIKSRSSKQVWYADDANGLGKFSFLEEFSNLLLSYGPARGIVVDFSQSHIIVSERNFDSAKEEFEDKGFKVVLGKRVLGSFIGDADLKQRFMLKKVNEWRDTVQATADMARHCPQHAFTSYQWSVQHCWTYVQRTTPDIGNYFDPLESTIYTELLPALFGFAHELDDVQPSEWIDFWKDNESFNMIRFRVSLPFKMGGLSMPYAHESDRQYIASLNASGYMLDCMTGKRNDFKLPQAKESVRCSRLEARGQYLNQCEDRLKESFDEFNYTGPERACLERAKHSSLILQIYPSSATHSILSPQQFRDILNLRYWMPFDNDTLPTYCDGDKCGKRFSVQHALNCNKGGKINSRHRLVVEAFAKLASLAFSKSRVGIEPKIHNHKSILEGAMDMIDMIENDSCHDVPESINPSTSVIPPTPTVDLNPESDQLSDLSADENAPEHVDPKHLTTYNPLGPNLRGDIVVDDFYEPGISCLFDVRITNHGSKESYKKPLFKHLDDNAREKIRKYGALCKNSNRHFTPLIATPEGVLHKEFKQALKVIGSRLAEKWNRPHSDCCKFVYSTIAIAIAHGTHRCIRSSRLPLSKISVPVPDWSNGIGLNLYGYAN